MNSILKLFRSGTEKVFEVEGRYALAAFRAVVLLMVLFFALYQDRVSLSDWTLARGLLGMSLLQAASNLFLALCPARWLRRGLAVGLFLFDILFVSCALYWTQGFETDLFLIYFLVVFMTVIARKPALSFAVASLSCVLYAYIFLKSNAVSGLLSPSVMIRFPLLLVTAFLSSVVARAAEMEKDDLAFQVQSYWDRSGRMFVVGDLASKMVYTLSRPLNRMLSSIELALSDPAGPSGGSPDAPEEVRVPRGDLLAIEKDVVRCQQMVGDLMQFAEEKSLQFEELDLSESLRNVLSLMENRLAFSGIEVEWKKDSADEPWVYGNRSQLQQVFYHLLTNACQAMPHGGRLKIGLDLHPAGEKGDARGRVSVSVEDNGVGIAPEDMDMIFRPFFTTRKAGQGTGLGLVTARNIVLAHEGQIAAESRGPGLGTRMTVTFPCHIVSRSAMPRDAAAARIPA